MTAMVFSVQQIKFEFLMYIKEFGGRAADWRVGLAADAPAALFGAQKVDPDADVWLWKPALSAAAARTVFRYMTEQFHVPAAEGATDGACVFLFRRRDGCAA